VVVERCRQQIVEGGQRDAVLMEQQAVVLRMRVGSERREIEDEALEERCCYVVLIPSCDPLSDEFADLAHSGAALFLILLLWRHGQRLRQVLLMQTANSTGDIVSAVVALYDQSREITVRRVPGLGVRDLEPDATCGLQSDRLCHIYIGQRLIRAGRFEDMSGRG